MFDHRFSSILTNEASEGAGSIARPVRTDTCFRARLDAALALLSHAAGPRGDEENAMSERTLIIANKAYSGWSLRPWLALRHTGLAFAEVVIPLNRPETRAEILAHSPSGKVPCLVEGAVVTWDSLAILEYLAERAPEAELWPRDRALRALARSLAAEMHSGFAALRRHLPMDLKREPGLVSWPEEAEQDIRRVEAAWVDCRARAQAQAQAQAKGPFLFGRFSALDAMFAPVATRFHTYAVPLSAPAAAYRDAILEMPAMRDWTAAAKAEPWVHQYLKP
jgi:glutathione S-transferase